MIDGQLLNGAAIAREIADITIMADDLQELVKLRRLSAKMMKKIKNNYRAIVGINGSLIGLGVLGVITPTTSAFVHNASERKTGHNRGRNHSR